MNPLAALITCLVERGMPPKAAFGVAVMLGCVLLLALAVLLSRWDQVVWQTWRKRRFVRWVSAQEARIAFLKGCGATEAAAVSTVVREAVVALRERHREIEQWRWQGPEATAHWEYLTAKADVLLAVASNERADVHERTAAAAAVKEVAEWQMKCGTRAVEFLKTLG
ncbi:MAG: hypothetical protein BroJett038_24530 [Chloroflexota bacterium]|nr:MAG: hypothetical protein BroJett038_24530 [Chloroflexota bacterium]